MWEYLTYSPEDLLMFSPRVYYRLFESYNREAWPAHVLTLGIGLAIAFLLLRPFRDSHRVIFAVLGVLWLWVGWAFLWERFAVINWPVASIAPLFVAQGLGLIVFGAAVPRLALSATVKPAIIAGLGLYLAALLLYPLISPALGRSWEAAEVFGLAPDPTALATLAVLAIATGGARWALMIVPALWCGVSAVTLWTMGSPDFAVPAAGAAMALLVALARR